MQSTFPFPGEAIFLACQWGTGNEKLKALSFVSFEKVLVSWETRRNNGFGWGFGTWLNQHHPQDISLQEQKLSLLVLQQQHCNRSDLSLFSILCQRYSQGSPLAKVLTLTLADNLLLCSDDMSFACTLLRTNPASTKLGRRWHNLSKKKCVSEKEEYYFPQITNSPSTYNIQIRPLNYSYKINQNSCADSGLLQTDGPAPGGSLLPPSRYIKQASKITGWAKFILLNLQLSFANCAMKVLWKSN